MLRIYNSDIMYSTSISNYLSSMFDINNSEYILEFKLTNIYNALKVFNIEIDKILNNSNEFKNILNNILLENLITKVLFNFDLIYSSNDNDMTLLISDILDDIAFSIPMNPEDIIPVYNLINKFITHTYEEEKGSIITMVNNSLKDFNLNINKCMVAYLHNYIINYKTNIMLFNIRLIYTE